MVVFAFALGVDGQSRFGCGGDVDRLCGGTGGERRARFAMALSDGTADLGVGARVSGVYFWGWDYEINNIAEPLFPQVCQRHSSHRLLLDLTAHALNERRLLQAMNMKTTYSLLPLCDALPKSGHRYAHSCLEMRIQFLILRCTLINRIVRQTGVNASNLTLCSALQYCTSHITEAI